MGLKTYKIKYTNSSRCDMQEMKRYILERFKYWEFVLKKWLGNNQ